MEKTETVLAKGDQLVNIERYQDIQEKFRGVLDQFMKDNGLSEIEDYEPMVGLLSHRIPIVMWYSKEHLEELIGRRIANITYWNFVRWFSANRDNMIDENNIGIQEMFEEGFLGNEGDVE